MVDCLAFTKQNVFVNIYFVRNSPFTESSTLIKDVCLVLTHNINNVNFQDSPYFLHSNFISEYSDFIVTLKS